MYWIDVTVENNTTKPIKTTINKGTVFEVKSLNSGAQCLVVERDVHFTIPPGVKVIKVPAHCMNRDASIPHHVPGLLTPFRFSKSFLNQQHLWSQINRG